LIVLRKMPETNLAALRCAREYRLVFATHLGDIFEHGS